MTPPDHRDDRLSLDQVTTRWTQIHDPVQFCLRYAPAVRAYLLQLLRDPHDADDVAQEFLLHAIRRGFPTVSPDRGRFRDYLKRAVRNAAITHQRKARPQTLGPELLEACDDPAAASPAEVYDEPWIAGWRSCLLDAGWRALDERQRTHEGNLSFTVLRAWVERQTEEDSGQVAALVSRQVGRPLTAAAFRKQLSRARRAFAEAIRCEAARTLANPSPEAIDDELSDLGLLTWLKRYLEEE